MAFIPEGWDSIAGGRRPRDSHKHHSDPERVEPHERKKKCHKPSQVAHLVFSTKNRTPIITPEVEPELFAYMGGILKNHDSRLLEAGGTSDHVHLVISQSKNIALSSLMKDVKKDSSSWIKTKGKTFRDFHWQDGYGTFSISQSEVPALKRYVANQKEHHRRRTFQEELIAFLREYELDYNEQYLSS